MPQGAGLGGPWIYRYIYIYIYKYILCAHIRCSEGKQKVALALLELIRDAPTGSTARREACGVLDLLARCALNLPEIGASAERLLPREDARNSTSRPK